MPALFALRSSSGDGERRERDAVLWLLACNALLPLAAYLVVTLPVNNEYKLLRVAAFPLGLLAAGPLVAALASSRAALRALGRTWLAATGLGAVALTAAGTAAYAKLASRDLPIVESALAVLPAPSDDARAEDLRRTYVWLRERTPELDAPPLLVANTIPVGPAYGSGDERHQFTTDLNLHGHEAPAFSGLALWCDRKSYLVDRHPRWEVRFSGLAQLYRDPTSWDAAHRAELDEVAGERGAVLLATERDRADNPVLGEKLARHGWHRVRDFGGVEVWARPAPLAERLADAP